MSKERFLEILNTENEKLTEKDKNELQSFLVELKEMTKKNRGSK